MSKGNKSLERTISPGQRPVESRAERIRRVLDQLGQGFMLANQYETGISLSLESALGADLGVESAQSPSMPSVSEAYMRDLSDLGITSEQI